MPDIYNNTTLTYHDYFYKMIITNTYAGEFEFINSIHLLRCNIFIYKMDKHNKDYIHILIN